jgi:hypothetical protein
MAEWLKAAVLKTVSGVTRSGVRIPLPPPTRQVLIPAGVPGDQVSRSGVFAWTL